VGAGAGALPSEHASAGGCGQRGGRACARGTATGGAKEMHARPVVVVGRAPRARAGRQYRQGSMRALCLCVHHRVDGGFHSARFGAGAGGPPTRLNKMLLPYLAQPDLTVRQARSKTWYHV
jgi:hypothetical protein